MAEVTGRATAHSVGDWQGQKELAARQFNRLIDALVVHYTMDDLTDRMHTAWDDWGSREELLTLSAEDIRQYIATVMDLPG